MGNESKISKMSNINNISNISNVSNVSSISTINGISNRSSINGTKKEFNIIGIGEVLWDMLPGGRKLGGAPANFAYHASALGANAYIISSVGRDSLGSEIISRLDELGLSSQYVQIDEEHPTGTVDVVLDEKGVPSYIIHESVAWDYLKVSEKILELAQRADVICFGSLAQRFHASHNTITEILKNVSGKNNSNCSKCLKVFDINLRQHFYNREIIQKSLQYANVLKLNDEELPILVRLLHLDSRLDCSMNSTSSSSVRSSAQWSHEYEREILSNLAKLYSLDFIALTRGEKGSLLMSKGQVSEHPGFKVEIADTVGAGDAFTAAVVMGLLHHLELDEINNLANKLASYVCSQEGGTPSLPGEFADFFAQHFHGA